MKLWFLKNKSDNKKFTPKYLAVAFLLFLLFASIVYLLILRKKIAPDPVEVFEKIEETKDISLCYELNEEYVPSCLAHYYTLQAVSHNDIKQCLNIEDLQKQNSCKLYYAITTNNCNILYNLTLQELCNESVIA
ncbi:MAG: hypothetical protein GXN99_00105 [Candidatus Nanohaloarchaeota archaeon]|nr:hypothetical protein [Candidatus Nanohaloarchaeota archaeon]